MPISNLELNNENTYFIDNKIRAINWLDKERLLLPQLYSYTLYKNHLLVFACRFYIQFF